MPESGGEESKMALKVPEAMLVKQHRPEKTSAEEEPLFRLPVNHTEDLRAIARGEEESDVGLCCSYLRDASSGEGRDFDEHALLALERYAEASLTFDLLGDLFGVARVSSWRARLLRARRALRRLREEGEGTAASVLFVAYGYPDPLVRQLPDLFARLGPSLGSLARYADATEERRLELVRAETSRLAARRGSVGERYRKGGDLRALAERDGYDADEFANLVDLSERRELTRYAEKTISSGDALRAALAPFTEPVPSPGWLRGEEREGAVEISWETPSALETRKAARRDREAAFRGRREDFLLRLSRETARMLSAAERAYRAAWLRSAAS